MRLNISSIKDKFEMDGTTQNIHRKDSENQQTSQVNIE